MNTIKSIQQQLVVLESEISTATAPIMERANTLKAALQAEFEKRFEKNRKLQKALKELDSSKQLTEMPNDEYYHRWVRFEDLVQYKDHDAKQALIQYLDERCIYADFEHHCLTTSEGPALIIDDDGDCFDQDSGKVVVAASAYENTAERNALIEAWMEKSGYFPSVIQVDRYGSPLGYVNTQAKKAGAK
jgi:hypothetical protein